MRKMTSVRVLRITKHEAGIVSIFTATMLIVVLSLIVLGLAQISRREQRVALDTQLSTQAFYAAESGVNDAVAAIQSQLSSGVQTKDQCGEQLGRFPTLTNARANLDASKNVRYSCLLINPTPATLPGTLSSNPTVFALTAANPGRFTTINIAWDPSTPGSPVSCPTQASINGADDFVPQASWACNYGMVRIDLVPTGSLTRASLMNNAVSAFFMPTQSAGGGATSYAALSSANGNGAVIPASCTAIECKVSITIPPGQNYYMKATSVYRSGFQARVSPNAGAGGFVNSVVAIDVTGQAQDVLRRIIVTVNITGQQTSVAQAAIMSGDSVCKRFSTFSGYFSIPTSMIGAEGNPLCDVVAGTLPNKTVPNGAYIPGSQNKPDGGGGGPSKDISWKRTYIISDASQLVATCTLEWGDGTSTTKSGQACVPNDPSAFFTHEYPHQNCTVYTTKLTLYYAAGGQYSPPQRTTFVPWGTLQADYGSPCK
jgi:hypothetical protein